MKRLRDDHVNSQFKRPLHGQPHIPGGGCDGGNGGGGGAGSGVAAQKLTNVDALTYLKEVKEMFEDQKEKYDMFLDVMKDFKAQRIDTGGVIERVKELFKGHNNLIYGFNAFLPKGYEITVIEEEEAQPRKTIEFEEAINFVNKIKTRFHNDDYVYKSFLDILNMYRQEHKGINEVYHEVAALFKDHQDLLDEFIRFLPDVSAVASEHHATLGRQPLHLYEEQSSPAKTLRGTHMDKQRFRRDRILAPHTVRDLSIEHPDLDDDKTTIKLHKEQRKRSEKESRDKRIRDKDYRDPDHDIHSLSEKRKSAQKVENFGGDPVLAPSDDKEALKSMYKQEFTFCEKVKERLKNADDYQAFLKFLNIYSSEIITRKELQGLVTDLIGKYPDLMEGFNEFLERCEKIDGFLADLMSKKYFCDETVTSKTVKEGDKDNKQRCGIDAAKENDRFKEKYWGKSIQELDLSDCERCTPSYRLLPKDYPIPTASQRSELGAQVLNDYWVSVTSGSEDYSFKHMRRNQYEESLFRCEDDRFELDMLLESVSSTIKRAEEILNIINEKTINLESPIRIENHFSALNLRCIECLYGDHGLDAMETLRKNPSHSLSVILTRLKQKQEEWSKCRSDFNKVWAEIYAKNHYKSLDHRSFYFKQQDSKNLSTKSLLAEIKELKEKRQQEDSVLLAIAAGSRHPIIPNLKLDYTDTSIHEDFYKLIKYSCDEICTSKEQSNKAMRLWRTFLEPMLSVLSRPLDCEESEVASVSRRCAIKSAVPITRERDGGLGTDAEILSSKLSKSLIDREAIYPDKKDTVRKSLFNGNLLNKENGLQKDLKHATVFDKGSASNETVASAECSASSVAPLAIGRDSVHSRQDTTQRLPSSAAEKSHGVPCNFDDAASLEHPDELRSVQLANRGLTENTCLNNCKEDSVEKEEDELSPNGDFEEDNFVAYGGSRPLPSTKENANTTHYHADIGENTSCQDAGGENNADADDEDSENASEAGEDVSGGESAADECLHEDQEEEEDGEHDEVEGRAESGCEAEEVDGALTVGDGSLLQWSERFLLTTKPLVKHVPSALRNNEKDSWVFYGNDAFYVLFRLHQILYERLLYAKQLSSSAEIKLRNVKDTSPLNLHAKFMKAFYNLLDGSSDNAKFEDDCRDVIGNQAYVLFTLDKLIYKLVKQLQTVASDEMDNKLLQLYEYEKSRKPGNFVDSVYYENAHVLLHDENIYRFESLSAPSRLLIQLMDDGNEKSEVVAASVDPHFAAYFHSDFLAVVPSKKESPGTMLLRNRRNYANHYECAAICNAMECVRVVNGLECKMASNSSKISYVLDTEDFFCRPRSKRRNLSTSLHLDEAKVQQFHQFLSAAV